MKKFITLFAAALIGVAAIGCSKPDETTTTEKTTTPAAGGGATETTKTTTDAK